MFKELHVDMERQDQVVGYMLWTNHRSRINSSSGVNIEPACGVVMHAEIALIWAKLD